MNGPSFFLGDGKNFRKEKLLNGAKQLVRAKAIFAGRGAAEQTDVEHDDILFAGPQTLQGRLKVIEGVIVADRNENVARMHTRRFCSELIFLSEIELIQFRTGGSAMTMRVALGDNEHQEEAKSEAHTG